MENPQGAVLLFWQQEMLDLDLLYTFGYNITMCSVYTQVSSFLWLGRPFQSSVCILEGWINLISIIFIKHLWGQIQLRSWILKEKKKKALHGEVKLTFLYVDHRPFCPGEKLVTRIIANILLMYLLKTTPQTILLTIQPQKPEAQTQTRLGRANPTWNRSSSPGGLSG